MTYEARALDILPGIFKEASDYASQGRYIDGDNVRFWKGFPERIGGSTRIADPQLLRPARGALAWRSLNSTQIIAFGHSRGVDLLIGGDITDVSPLGTDGYATLTIIVGTITGGPYTADEVVTTANGGSGTVVANAAASPVLISGDNGTAEIAFSGGSGTFVSGEIVTAAGGGTAKVVTGGSVSPLDVIDETGTFTGTFSGANSGASGTITSITTHWTGTLTGGGSGATSTITSVSETNAVDGGATTAFGETTWGSSVFGGTESLFSSVLDPLTWTLETWGEDLIACPRGGAIYTLDTSAFLGDDTTNLAKITNSPVNALGVFMNDANRTLIAYGAHDGSSSDLVNLRWCDEEDFTNWTAGPDNTSGSIRCENGSFIVGIMSGRGAHLISTDTAVYNFQFIGLPFVFSLNQLSEGAPMVGPNASAEQDGTTYWMGKDGFYLYDGTVLPLPCDVHQYVFGRINVVQAHKVFCSNLRAYNEVWWFYVSDQGTEIDSYVSYNTVERVWHIGSKARTAMIDTSVVLSYPTAARADGALFAEELGTTEDGDPFSYSLETSDIEVADGTVFLHNRKLIPDFDRIAGTHNVTIEARGWPQRSSITKGPFNVSSSTEHISVRARGRMLRFLFAGDDDIRWGRWRYRVTGHGRR